jgi:hypothetical protein
MRPSCAQYFRYDAWPLPSLPTVFVQAASAVVCAASSPSCVYFILSILVYCFRFLLCFVSCLIPFHFVVSAWWVEPYCNAHSPNIRVRDALLWAFGRASGTNITSLCCMSTFMWQWHFLLETWRFNRFGMWKFKHVIFNEDSPGLFEEAVVERV